MAYSFATASSQFISSSSVPVSAMPLTMACWFRVPVVSSSTGGRVLFGAAHSTNDSGFYRLTIPLNGTFLRASLGGDQFNTTTADTAANTIVANTWLHCAAVFTSTTSRTIYLTNAAAVTTTATIVAPTINNFTIGATILNTGTTGYFNGLIAESAVWRVALTAADVASLAAGVAPSHVRPQSLAFYAPLIRTLSDSRGGATLTNNGGATVTDHPRIYA